MPSNGTALNQQPAEINKIFIGKRGELWLKPRSSAWEAEWRDFDSPPTLGTYRWLYSHPNVRHTTWR